MLPFGSTIRFSLILLLIFCCACQNNPDTISGKIAQLEKGISKANPAKKEDLIAAYEEHVSTYPDRHEENADYLYKAALLCESINRIPKAIGLLQQALKDHYTGNDSPNSATLMAKIYREHVGNENLEAITLQAGAKAFPAFGKLTKAVQKDWPSITDRLAAIKSATVDSSGLNYVAVNDFINGSSIYAMLLPKAENTSKILFDAGRIANQSKSYPKALELFDWLSTKYPEYEKNPEALFVSAFILDRDLKRYDEAKIKYETFLEKYPDNQFAKDAQFLLENLGVPPAEIIKRFEEANQ